MGQITLVPDPATRAKATTELLTALLSWWSFVNLGIWGLYIGGNVTQKWLTQETYWKEKSAELEQPEEKEENPEYDDIPGII